MSDGIAAATRLKIRIGSGLGFSSEVASAAAEAIEKISAAAISSVHQGVDCEYSFAGCRADSITPEALGHFKLAATRLTSAASESGTISRTGRAKWFVSADPLWSMEIYGAEGRSVRVKAFLMKEDDAWSALVRAEPLTPASRKKSNLFGIGCLISLIGLAFVAAGLVFITAVLLPIGLLFCAIAVFTGGGFDESRLWSEEPGLATIAEKVLEAIRRDTGAEPADPSYEPDTFTA